jgi:hypothetical protein
MATTLQLPLELKLKVVTVEQIHKNILFKEIKVTVQLISSNIGVFIKVLGCDLIALDLISSFIFIKLRYISMQIILL